MKLLSNALHFFVARPSLIAAPLMLLLSLSLSSRADTVKTASGETLLGSVVQETPDFVLFRSASFGEIMIPRSAGPVVTRAPSRVAEVSPAPSPSTPATPPGGPAPSPSLVAKTLGLSDRWSFELEANLLVQNDAAYVSNGGGELTIGYKIPNETKPAQPRHEYGLFGAYNFLKVDGVSVSANSEIAARYFYQPISPWLLVSQADWMRDRINYIESRSHLIAIPAYRFIDTKATRLVAGIGPSFMTDSRIISTGKTTHGIRKTSGFRGGFYELFQRTLTPALKFRQSLIILSEPADPTTTYNLRLEASLSRMLTQHLSLNLAYSYTADKNEEFASESIATLRLMLGYRF